MNPIFTAALDLQRWCDSRRWPFCIIGGVAVQRWGEPRFTRDVDCTILVGFGNEASHVDALLEGFAPRVQDARVFALANRVLLLVHDSGTPLDVSLGARCPTRRVSSNEPRHSQSATTPPLRRAARRTSWC